MTLRTRTLAWSAGLTVVLAVVLVISAGIGPVSIPPATVAKALLSADPLPLGFETPRTSRIIVLDVRLPRIALAAFVGVALATAGTVIQGFFRNPTADPSSIGISSGAAVGAVATIAFPFTFPFRLELHSAAFLATVLILSAIPT